MVENLLGTLLKVGAIKDQPLEATDLTEAERLRFLPQIELISHYADRPMERFNSFRKCRLLICGGGLALTSLAASLVRNGVEEALIASPEEDFREVETEIEELRRAGVRAAYRLITSPANDFDVDFSNYQFVVYCSDAPSLSHLYKLNGECYRKGRSFLAGFFLAGHLFIGPLVKAGKRGCWLCAMMRLSSNLGDRARSKLWQAIALGENLCMRERETFALTTRIMSSAVSFELFKLAATDLPAETEGGVIVQELRTLEGRRAALLPHPLCPVCSADEALTEEEVLTEIIEGEHDRELMPGVELKHWDDYIDPHFGVIRSQNLTAIEGSPLRAASLVLGSPMIAEGAAQFYGYGMGSPQAARSEALREAIGWYTTSLPDERRIIRASFQQLLSKGIATIDAKRLSIWSRGRAYDHETIIEWFPACDVNSKQVCFVPAAAAYPLSPLNRDGVFDRTQAGSTIGLTFEDIRISGSLSMLCYERMRELMMARGDIVKYDARVLASHNEAVACFLMTLDRLSRRLDIFELKGASPLRAILVRAVDPTSNSSLFEVGWGLSLLEAVEHSLKKMLGALEMQIAEAERQRGGDFFWPGLSLPEAVSEFKEDDLSGAVAGFEAVDRYLKESAIEVLFIDTTTSDVRHTGTFMTGTILFARQLDTKAHS